MYHVVDFNDLVKNTDLTLRDIYLEVYQNTNMILTI